MPQTSWNVSKRSRVSDGSLLERCMTRTLSRASEDLPVRSPIFNPDAPPRKRRTLRLCEPEVYHFTTTDGVQLRLVRYHGGPKGPVILSHAFGTSSLLYLIDTIEPN